MTNRPYEPVWELVRPHVERAQPRGTLPKPNAEGWIDGLHSPLRQDHNPSFSVMPDSESSPGGWRDFGTGEKGSMRDLARRLGIELQGPSSESGSAELTLEGFCERRRLDPVRLQERWKVREVQHSGRPAIAWQTPISRTLLRVKYLDGGRPKYRWWAGGKGGAPHLYGLKAALEHMGSDGVIYLVNGEASVWACDQEGVPAVCVGGGESTPPTPDMVAQLAAGGVKLVRVAYNRDEAGQAGAQKAAVALREGGLRAVALALPKQLGPKGDVDDLHRWEGAELGPVLARMPALPEVGELVLTKLSSVAPQKARSLDRGRLWFGKLNLLGGDPGVGKSFVSLAWASAITNGVAFPDGEAPNGPGEVMLLNYEDGLADTIRMRAEALGVHLDRLTVIEGAIAEDGRTRGFQLTDLPRLDDALSRMPDVRLLIIDPVLQLMGGNVDAARDNEVRAALHPLADLAARHGVAVLGVMHLRKGDSPKALYRIANSIAFSGLARSVLLAAREADSERTAVAHIKCNLGPLLDPVEYRIVGAGEEASLEWLGVAPELGEADLLAPPSGISVTEREEAAEFLRSILQDGPLAARDVIQEARRAGIAERTLQRASKDLGVTKRRDNEAGGKRGQGGWVWELLQGHPLLDFSSKWPPLTEIGGHVERTPKPGVNTGISTDVQHGQPPDRGHVEQTLPETEKPHVEPRVLDTEGTRPSTWPTTPVKSGHVEREHGSEPVQSDLQTLPARVLEALRDGAKTNAQLLRYLRLENSYEPYVRAACDVWVEVGDVRWRAGLQLWEYIGE
ncbi:MAG: AAA family ATPase [Chloroflexota bacterium]|nr:AAA family ATPase [Chloroflexota bacterium]